MPTVFYFKGYRFYFFSQESDEPVHIHVEKAEASAKFWLEPEIREEYSYGFSGRQRKEIKQIIIDNLDTLKRAWHEHFK
ncbi:DUF4160 domain-containing protein [Terrimonas pollutisoli]|uniref:DUF4160 domain-containing protein n=1 Tax=Terrimonas pollutisoli TaxID=3034147 RepID=UPI0023EDF1FF|nr:DUF4160 domain-containing protein [Terrimonas sp. H1YJ31]